jgi:hypothetical protein
MAIRCMLYGGAGWRWKGSRPSEVLNFEQSRSMDDGDNARVKFADSPYRKQGEG